MTKIIALAIALAIATATASSSSSQGTADPRPAPTAENWTAIILLASTAMPVEIFAGRCGLNLEAATRSHRRLTEGVTEVAHSYRLTDKQAADLAAALVQSVRDTGPMLRAAPNADLCRQELDIAAKAIAALNRQLELVGK